MIKRLRGERCLVTISVSGTVLAAGKVQLLELLFLSMIQRSEAKKADMLACCFAIRAVA